MDIQDCISRWFFNIYIYSGFYTHIFSFLYLLWIFDQVDFFFFFFITIMDFVSKELFCITFFFFYYNSSGCGFFFFLDIYPYCMVVLFFFGVLVYITQIASRAWAFFLTISVYLACSIDY